MQLAKPSSSSPQATVIAPANAAVAPTSNSTTTPFSALLESHHEGQQHSPAPKNHPSAAKESAGHESAAPVEKTQDLSRVSRPERPVDRQAERNRLNAQREAKQSMNRAATPPSSKVPSQDQVRDTGPAAQNVAQEDSAAVDEQTNAKTPGESAFNPLALLQWISNQAAQPALVSITTAVAPEAQELPGSDEQPGDTAEQTGILHTFSTIKTAADSSAASMGQPWVDKTPGARAGLTGKLPLASGLLATSASRTANLDAPQKTEPHRPDPLSMGSTPHLGAMGLEGWTRTLAGSAADISNALPGPLPKLAPASNVAETNNTPQPFALGPGNSGVADIATVSVNLPTPVQSPEFRELLGSQISLLAKDGVQSAELHLNPAEMGPVSVQITLDGTQARVDFGADSAQTRQYIEASLPELASALRDAGLTLSGGGVSQHAHGRENQQETSRAGGRGKQAPGEDAADAVSRLPASTRRVALGGVDVYV